MPVISNFPTDTGVTSFNGRKGAVTPQSGDYTAAQVGAVPTTRKVNNKALSADISLTASDVGARPSSWTPTAADVGAAAASHGTHVSFSTTAPKADGTASAGTAGTVARSDHVHPTDTSRAAANHTHTKSQISDFPTSMPASDVPAWAKAATKPSYTASEVGALASGGTAAAATKLATARNIKVNLASGSSASFNGTADASPGVGGILPIQFGGTGVNSLDGLKAELGLTALGPTAFGVSATLNDNSWANIKKVSDAGMGANCWSIGDTKSVLINGTIGTLAVNATCWAFILGFNHNSAIEGKGITFGGFKTAQTGGKDICLVDAKYNSNVSDGTKCFNLNHWGSSSSPYNTNYGGWKGCDARYDVLGSTNKAPSGYGSTATTSRVGYDPVSYDIVSSPVANTLMAALPMDLRSVMKPITKYTDNKGNSSNTAAGVSTSIDYLPLLAEFEIFGARSYANQYEQNYQKQYAYYAAGNSKVRYRHSATTSTAWWWERSPYYTIAISFCSVTTNGTATGSVSRISYGLAPAFMV